MPASCPKRSRSRCFSVPRMRVSVFSVVMNLAKTARAQVSAQARRGCKYLSRWGGDCGIMQLCNQPSANAELVDDHLAATGNFPLGISSIPHFHNCTISIPFPDYVSAPRRAAYAAPASRNGDSISKKRSSAPRNGKCGSDRSRCRRPAKAGAASSHVLPPPQAPSTK